jgi:hypothetical protein
VVNGISNFTTKDLKEIMLIIKQQEDKDIDSNEAVKFIKEAILDLCSNKSSKKFF